MANSLFPNRGNNTYSKHSYQTIRYKKKPCTCSLAHKTRQNQAKPEPSVDKTTGNLNRLNCVQICTLGSGFVFNIQCTITHTQSKSLYHRTTHTNHIRINVTKQTGESIVNLTLIARAKKTDYTTEAGSKQRELIRP